MFDHQIYEQTDGVSMGSSLAPVLANIILTEFEKVIVSNLLKDGTIKYYRRYVDDTLVLIKPADISTVLEKFNKFDKKLKFTVDIFPDGVVHFLDIKIENNTTDVYYKNTHTGQYMHFSSFELFTRFGTKSHQFRLNNNRCVVGVIGSVLMNLNVQQEVKSVEIVLEWDILLRCAELKPPGNATKLLLQSSTAVLCSPGGTVTWYDEIKAFLSYKSVDYSVRIFVVCGENVNCMLGRELSCKMGLVKVHLTPFFLLA